MPSGNTPTSVGKTLGLLDGFTDTRKHPHERGEDIPRPYRRLPVLETPPRAWGRRWWQGVLGSLGRNTPTSVGKTPSRRNTRWALWKHPHERGEDTAFNAGLTQVAETPPRAWGRPVLRELFLMQVVKHPHERGEDSRTKGLLQSNCETPPRAWGRPTYDRLAKKFGRNTPTSVGKTSRGPPHSPPTWKHPHERGEDGGRFYFQFRRKETPPRAWGRPPQLPR